MADKNMIIDEAISRIETLTEKYSLNPNILKYFKQGKVYYSYLTAGGFMASIDTISYDPAYEKAVRDFEAYYSGYKVYHAIEAHTAFGKMLSLLYVSSDENEWEMERLYGNSVMSYTVNMDEPDESEFGYITVGQFGESGALVRIG